MHLGFETFRIIGPNPGWKLIWPWEITMFNWRCIFKWLSFRCHVKIFRGVFVDGISSKSRRIPSIPGSNLLLRLASPPKKMDYIYTVFFRKGTPCWVYKSQFFVGEMSKVTDIKKMGPILGGGSNSMLSSMVNFEGFPRQKFVHWFGLGNQWAPVKRIEPLQWSVDL